MIDIKFSYNWNHKLDCHAFTTIRLWQPAKYQPGTACRLLLKDQIIGTGIIKDVNKFLLHQLSSFISFIDTGYSVEETQKIILKMYPKIDFSLHPLALILIVKDEKKKNVPDLFNQSKNTVPV